MNTHQKTRVITKEVGTAVHATELDLSAAEDAATRRAQLEMCLPEWEDDETRAGNAWQAAQESDR